MDEGENKMNPVDQAPPAVAGNDITFGSALAGGQSGLILSPQKKGIICEDGSGIDPDLPSKVQRHDAKIVIIEEDASISKLGIIQNRVSI